MKKNHPALNCMLFLIQQVLLLIIVVQRHDDVVVLAAADNHINFKWEGLHPKLQHERQRGRRRQRAGGLKGGGGRRQLQDTAATSTTTTATTTTSTSSNTGTVDDAMTLIFPYMAHKSHSGDNKSKNKLKKQREDGYSRDCGWGRKNVVVHTVYESRNIEEAKPNEYMSGLGFDFDVVSLLSSDDDYEMEDLKLNGHWTQTVLAISENIRIGHDELTFYQTNMDNANNVNNTDTEHDISNTIMNNDQTVAGVLTTQFDSTLNVAIVTAGSGLFECAQGNPQVEFDEGSTIVTIVWDLCVCETAMIPPPPLSEEEEDDDDDLDHDEELQEDEAQQEEEEHFDEAQSQEEEPLNGNHTTVAATATP